MAFKARKLKKGMFEVLGLEAFVEGRIAELKRTLLGRDTRPAPKHPTRKALPARKVKVTGPSAPDALDVVVGRLESHGKRSALVKLGKQKDQLLRSLIPLYLAQGTKVEITSGVMSRFWKAHGVKYAAPNAAKALRNHAGYARDTKLGKQITSTGIRYVEHALSSKLRAH